MASSEFGIDFHPLVETDYTDAYQWYETRQAGLGNRLMLHISEKLHQIQNAPYTYGIKVRKGYREASVDNFPYVIVYKIYRKKNRIFVSSILHNKLNPNKKYR
jgi:hypothetical protein